MTRTSVKTKSSDVFKNELLAMIQYVYDIIVIIVSLLRGSCLKFDGTAQGVEVVGD
jgi:hypothetical protein